MGYNNPLQIIHAIHLRGAGDTVPKSSGVKTLQPLHSGFQ